MVIVTISDRKIRIARLSMILNGADFDTWEGVEASTVLKSIDMVTSVYDANNNREG